MHISCTPPFSIYLVYVNQLNEYVSDYMHEEFVQSFGLLLNVSSYYDKMYILTVQLNAIS